jgi:thermitase
VNSNANTSDLLGHGTTVAGTIAAASDNGIGVAGVSWQSRIMPLVVVDENDFAAYSNIAEAIRYAADRNIRVINISIGGARQSATLQNAVDYAWSKGALIFAPAMNNGTSTLYYPAACNHVMSVSATDSYDHLASFSNYGNWIAIAAPGTNILTTTNGGGYGYSSGTSLSSPIVAGVAALSLAINPSLTNIQLVSLLEQSADDIGDSGYDNSFGWGRVNAFRTVEAARQMRREKHPPAPMPPYRNRLP